MATKKELLADAEALGIEGLTQRSGNAEIEEAIATAKAENEVVWPAAELESLSERLFGQPRSVFRGARSAGFIGDEVTKTEAAKGVAEFLKFDGKEKG